MPPKPGKKTTEPSNKTITKEKQKVVEDKTFGLKNAKKSKVVQRYKEGITNQIMKGDIKGGAKAEEARKFQEKEESKKAKEKSALIASLFKAVVDVKKTDDGKIDYKKTVCPNFKGGMCEKGKKCKYSHDLSLEDQRQQNIDMYTDPRAALGKMPDTIITCRDFIKAIEQEKYGFNWICPNQGENCPFRHMLPQGYVINREKAAKGDSDSEEELTLEEKIEEERAALPAEGGTQVTAATFKAWKERKAREKQEALEKQIAAEAAKGKKNVEQMAFMSGKALFTYNPDLFEDAEGAADDDAYDENQEEDKPIQNGNQEEAKEGMEEETKEEVKVDQDLFQNNDDEEEEPDFDDD